jgi:hypothetical protein
MVRVAALDGMSRRAYTLRMERHSAYKRSGKPAYTTAGDARELEILKLLSRYDLLSSDYIYHALDNWQAARKALTRLSAGHYIGFPDIEKTGDPDEDRRTTLAYIPRNGFYVFELKPRGKALLAQEGILPKTGGNDHFKHRLLRSKVEYLLDRAPSPIVVKGHDDILLHPACPPATRALPYPFRVPPRPALEPDITRGFAAGDSALFVHVEVDRGTEVKRSLKSRQSLGGKIARYARYFAGRDYETHFGFRVAPSVLIVTTRPDTSDMPDLIKEYAGSWHSRFRFIRIAQKPPPTHSLFAPWQGADGALDLMEVLGVRREEGSSSERAGANHQAGGSRA